MPFWRLCLYARLSSFRKLTPTSSYDMSCGGGLFACLWIWCRSVNASLAADGNLRPQGADAVCKLNGSLGCCLRTFFFVSCDVLPNKSEGCAFAVFVGISVSEEAE